MQGGLQSRFYVGHSHEIGAPSDTGLQIAGPCHNWSDRFEQASDRATGTSESAGPTQEDDARYSWYLAQTSAANVYVFADVSFIGRQ